MNNITIDDLLEVIRSYNEEEIEYVKKAYDLANRYHSGQKRQSGEEYIIHPLNVAYTLALMKADRDTVCAGLLHDVLEDTDITDEEIKTMFNEDVYNLVFGVTKINNIHFVKSEDIIMENTRKIITSLKNDIRIIIIKLADRLHNMRTLQFKKPEKQVKNAIETMEIFVPIAHQLGLYHIKEELEDISFMYLNNEEYRYIKTKKAEILKDKESAINVMILNVKNILKQNNIKFDIKIDNLNINAIEKRLKKGYKFEEIHNLISFIIKVENEKDCYEVLRLVHKLYHPINHKFKDYISNPKTNLYQSLHTTVFGEESDLVQVQIKTYDMDKMATLGIVSYWEDKKEKAANIMQADLMKKYQFFGDLAELDDYFGDNYQFVNLVKNEVLNEKIYTYSPNGSIVELPLGSTPIDFAYKIHTEVGNKMVSAIVNDIAVDVDYVLKNKDRVKILTDDSYFNRSDWVEKAYTSYAKRKIKEYLKENKNI